MSDIMKIVAKSQQDCREWNAARDLAAEYTSFPSTISFLGRNFLALTEDDAEAIYQRDSAVMGRCAALYAEYRAAKATLTAQQAAR